MSLHTVNIRGINITNSPKKEILEELEKFMADGSWFMDSDSKIAKNNVSIVTPNPEQIVYANDHPKFADVLNRADVAIPDGVGIVWASNFLASKHQSVSASRISKSVPGVEFMEELVAVSAKRHVPIALIGGKEKVALEAFECLRQRHPDLMGIAMDAPIFEIGAQDRSESSGDSQILRMKHVSQENDKFFQYTIQNTQYKIPYSGVDDYFITIASLLKEQGIGMVFVALGAPKQELFMESLSLSLRVSSGRGEAISQNKRLPRHFVPRNDKGVVLMSVGGSLDEISGRVSRAPKWVSGLGVKWLWRLILEPWRFTRQLALIKFVWLVLQDRLS